MGACVGAVRDEHPPTLLVDEADALFGTRRAAENNEELRALLNAGHQRGRPATRCVGPRQVPTEFPTFAMAALAGIGDMPDTITDRAVVVLMRRRQADETVMQFRTRRDGPVLAELRGRLGEWLAQCLPDLADAEPDMPLEDRAADTWEPLVAVADLAGGAWPVRARAAAVALVAANDEDDADRSLTMKLLADIRNVFARLSVSFLPSSELVAELRRLDESPWDDFDLNARKLALRLKHFGIKPKSTGSVRGYAIEALVDAFSRYLRHEPSQHVNTTADLHKRPDGSGPTDTSNRQLRENRQGKTAGERANLRNLTDSGDCAEQHDFEGLLDGGDTSTCDCDVAIPAGRNCGPTVCGACTYEYGPPDINKPTAAL